MSERDEPIRLTMTLPGSASLGAFQAGAVSALSVIINGLRKRDQEVAIDVVGGSSAGSIVALLFAHCMLTGRDVPNLMCSAWVDQVDLGVLRSGGSDEPFTTDRLRRRLVEFVDDREKYPYGAHDALPSPTTVQIGLTSLLGFRSPVETAEGESSGLSYADWIEFELDPEHEPSRLHEGDGPTPLDAILASASHPGGFAPASLDRSDDRESYEERGITNLPDDTSVLWYTDGGLVESTPIGRIVSAARRRFGPSERPRLHLVIDPRSSGPSGDESWADPTEPKAWIDGVRRSMSIVPTQALHDDLRGVAKTNRRLERVEEAVERLRDGFAGDEGELRDLLRDVAGVTDCERVDVEMISPLRHADDDEGVNDLLAGDFIGAFGGFLDAEIRRSDFSLGWHSTAGWMKDGLARHGVSDDLVSQLRADLDREQRDAWDGAVSSDDGVDQLGWKGRWKLTVLAAQFARVLVNSATPAVPSLPSLPFRTDRTDGRS